MRSQVQSAWAIVTFDPRAADSVCTWLILQASSYQGIPGWKRWIINTLVQLSTNDHRAGI